MTTRSPSVWLQQYVPYRLSQRVSARGNRREDGGQDLSEDAGYGDAEHGPMIAPPPPIVNMS